jgi:hypothetical protein
MGGHHNQINRSFLSIVYNFEAGVPDYGFKLDYGIGFVRKTAMKRLLNLSNPLPIADGLPNCTGIHGLEGEEHMEQI